MYGKQNGRCAILPVLETQSTWLSGQEYLAIYLYIDYEKVKNGE